jgi:hypothetical protein
VRQVTTDPPVTLDLAGHRPVADRHDGADLPRDRIAHIVAMYHIDTSGRRFRIARSPGTALAPLPQMIAASRMRGAGGYEQPALWRPRARHPRHPA